MKSPRQFCDIAFGNAGISGDDKTPDQEDAGTFPRIYETNVFGVVAEAIGALTKATADTNAILHLTC